MRRADGGVEPDRGQAGAGREERGVLAGSLDSTTQRLDLVGDTTHQDDDRYSQAGTCDLGCHQAMSVGQLSQCPRRPQGERSDLQHRMLGIDVQACTRPVVEIREDTRPRGEELPRASTVRRLDDEPPHDHSTTATDPAHGTAARDRMSAVRALLTSHAWLRSITPQVWIGRLRGCCAFLRNL